MAAVFGEWRRGGSLCGGGLVLWMRDLMPGAGWGVVDHSGAPKVAYHHLRRALAPRAVWLTDEGLGGIDAHVANDGPEPFSGRLRIGFYRDFEQQVGEVEAELDLKAHGAGRFGVEALLGRFIDASWSYRFGPPAQNLIVASLEDRDGALVSQDFFFPAGRPTAIESRDRLGVKAQVVAADGGALRLTIGSRRLVYGLRVTAAGFAPSDDAFSVEPGKARTIELRPVKSVDSPGNMILAAINLDGRVTLPLGS